MSAIFLNTSVKTSIVISGCKIAQPAPIIVCLYLTFTSRQMRKYNNSRQAQSSDRLSATQPREGSMRRLGILSFVSEVICSQMSQRTQPKDEDTGDGSFTSPF